MATASGLCRVDNLKGRWARSQIPYGGVHNLRLETAQNHIDEDAMNVDAELDEIDADGEVDE